MSESETSKRTNAATGEKSAKDTSMQMTAKSPDTKTAQASPVTNSWQHMAQDLLIAFILLLLACFQYILYLAALIVEAIYDFLRKAFRIARFCYLKPHHAKEIFYTTLHLISVSYDAGLWSLNDIYQIIAGQMGVMVRTPASTPPNTEATHTQ